MPQSLSPARRTWVVIPILGALMTVSPFAIDMYLPSFPQLASDIGSTTARVSLTVSSYFLALAFGHLFYGPLLDRFGRKSPLYAGLFVYLVASLGCVFANNLETLVVLRFIQGLGGCVAGIAALTLVRDFFPVEDTAKIFSLLIFLLGVSPLLAPTLGSIVAVTLGWRWIFVLLAGLAAFMMALVFFFLPHGAEPDSSVSLRPGPVFGNFFALLRRGDFSAYAFTGALSFVSLFLFVAGSPVIFMDRLHVSPSDFGIVFAVLTGGFILSNQANAALLRKFTSRQLLSVGLIWQVAVAVVFLVVVLVGGVGLIGTMVLFFLCLSCLGLTFPNASALALSTLSTGIGTASALSGFLQMGMSGAVLVALGVAGPSSGTPSIAIMAITALLALTVFLVRKRQEARSS